MTSYKNIVGNINAYLLIIKDKWDKGKDYSQDVLSLLNYQGFFINEEGKNKK